MSAEEYSMHMIDRAIADGRTYPSFGKYITTNYIISKAISFYAGDPHTYSCYSAYPTAVHIAKLKNETKSKPENEVQYSEDVEDLFNSLKSKTGHI